MNVVITVMYTPHILIECGRLFRINEPFVSNLSTIFYALSKFSAQKTLDPFLKFIFKITGYNRLYFLETGCENMYTGSKSIRF